MNDAIYCRALAALFGWSLLMCGAALASQRRPARPVWRAFWLMTGVLGIAEGLLGVGALLAGPLPPARLGPLLRVKAAFDGLGLAAGAILATRPSPRDSGCGLAIVAATLVLLTLDVWFWQACESLL
jgi:hypothetical protein